MPPLPATPAIKIEALFTDGAGVEFVNIFHVAYTGGPPTGATLLAFAGVVDVAIDNFITTAISNTCHHFQTVYTDLSSPSGAVVVTNPGTTGGNAGTVAPISVAAVCSWKIARRYRGGHPRTYVGGLVDGQLHDANTLDSTFQGNLQSQASTFIGAIGALGGTLPGSTLVCVSYFTGHALRVTPVQEVITNVSVSDFIRSQRRRLSGSK